MPEICLVPRFYLLEENEVFGYTGLGGTAYDE